MHPTTECTHKTIISDKESERIAKAIIDTWAWCKDGDHIAMAISCLEDEAERKGSGHIIAESDADIELIVNGEYEHFYATMSVDGRVDYKNYYDDNFPNGIDTEEDILVYEIEVELVDGFENDDDSNAKVQRALKDLLNKDLPY